MLATLPHCNTKRIYQLVSHVTIVTHLHYISVQYQAKTQIAQFLIEVRINTTIILQCDWSMWSRDRNRHTQ